MSSTLKVGLAGGAAAFVGNMAVAQYEKMDGEKSDTVRGLVRFGAGAIAGVVVYKILPSKS